MQLYTLNRLSPLLAMILFLIAFASSAQIAQRLTNGGDSRIKDVLILPNKHYIAIGQHFTYSDSITHPNMILLLDENGMEIKKLIIGQDGYNKKKPNESSIDKRVKSIVQLPSGEIYIFGAARSSYPNTHDLWVIQVDQDLHVIQEKYIHEIPASNNFYMQTKVNGDDLFLVCQTTEEHKEKVNQSSRPAVRLVKFDRHLNITKQWNHFAILEPKAYESLDLVNVFFEETSIYIAASSMWMDSLDFYDRNNEQLGTKIFRVDLKNEAAQLVYHTPSKHDRLNAFVVLNDTLVLAKNYFYKDSLNQYKRVLYLEAVDPNGKSIWKFDLKKNATARQMYWHNNTIWLAGDGSCNRGSYRIVQAITSAGKVLKTDESFCDYSKEHVGLTFLGNNRYLEYFIDNGWFMRISEQ